MSRSGPRGRTFSGVEFAVWAVLAEGSIVGHAELKPSPRDDIDGWELVYVIRRTHWRKGYGRLVVSLVTHYGFDDLRLPVVFATVDGENTPSLMLLKGLGFEHIREADDGGRRDLTSRSYRSRRVGEG